MNMDDLELEPERSSGSRNAWMATFADMMTLLLCFFILLLSFATMDIVKFRQALGSVQEALGVQPGNRDPTKEEIARHTPYLVRQIKTIQPEVIVTLGNFATKFALAGFSVEGMEKIDGITQLHGKMHEVTVDGVKMRIIPSYHPAAMLYKPQLREVIEQDFKNMSPFLEMKKSKNLKDFF